MDAIVAKADFAVIWTKNFLAGRGHECQLLCEDALVGVRLVAEEGAVAVEKILYKLVPLSGQPSVPIEAALESVEDTEQHHDALSDCCVEWLTVERVEDAVYEGQLCVA